MSTFCHGVASAQSLDKSGEIVDIKGLDITSLPRTGILNYEHKSDLPGQICGKILTAKKIFSEKDCSNDNELYFWNKTKTPFLYITAELLDDYCQSGKDAAGILKYDHDKKDQNKHAILGFSVEGSEIPNSRGSNRMVVARGIARKVTLTSAPCNSQCIAELLIDSPKSQVKDDFEQLFRSEQEAITLFKSGEGIKIYETYLAKKELEPKEIKPKHNHKEAAERHRNAAVTAEDAKTADDHIEKMKFHNNAALSEGKKMKKKEKGLCELHKAKVDEGKPVRQKLEARFDRNSRTRTPSTAPGAPSKSVGTPKMGVTGIHQPVKHGGAGYANADKKGGTSNVGEILENHGIGSHVHEEAMSAASKIHGKKLKDLKTMPKPNLPKSEPDGNLKKAITAGSMNASPSTLVNGSAYQTESLGSKQAATGAEENSFQGTKKKDWNKRAKDDYNTWPNREKFEKFMQARMPHLAMGEIRAIGRTLSLKKSIDFEKSLNSLVSFTKSELDEKSLKDIQKETAEKWAKRAEDAYKRAVDQKSVKWLLDADEFFHEAIEHSSLSEDLSTFEAIRAKLMPIRKKAFKLLAPDADS